MKLKVYFFLVFAILFNLLAKANIAPYFVGGSIQSLVICANSTSTVDSFLLTNDLDIGQSLTWAITKSPVHGTLHGFPGNLASNGGNVAPTGFSYSPTTGYSGIDSFNLTVSDGIATAQTKIVILINSATLLSPITGSTSLCVGKNSTLSNATTGGTWISSNTSVATINNSTGVVNGLAAGTSTIYYTVFNSNGCTSTVSTTVTVNAYPNVPNITGTNTVCVGSTTTFSNNLSGGVWTSSNYNVADIDASGIITGITGSNNGTRDTITYTVTNGSACSTSVTRSVTVYAVPTISPITGTTNVCNGNTTQLANATGGGTWSSLNTAIAVVSNQGLVTAVAVGTDTIRYTVTSGRGGCTNDTDVVITVSTAPVVGPIISSSNNLCVGAKMTLSDTTAGGVWSSSNVGVASVTNTGLVTGLAAGNVTIRYIVTNGVGGCSTTVSRALTIRSLPTITPISGSTSTCVGSSVALTNNTTGGVWSSTNDNIATVTNLGVVTGVALGLDTILYTVTNGSNCSAIASFPMSIVTGIPVKPIEGVTKLCSSNSTTLTDSTPSGSWSSSDPSIAFVTSSGTVIGVSGGTCVISYTVSSGSGCTGTANLNFTVYQIPDVPDIAGVTKACIGGTTTLTNSTPGGIWTSSNNSVATVTDGVVNALTVGSVVISYTVAGSGGCSQTVPVNVTVNPLPVIKPITGSNSTCLGAVSQYTDTAGGVWSSSNTAVATIDKKTGVFQTKSAGTTLIKFIFTDGNVCTISDSINVLVGANLYVSKIKGNANVCQTLTTTLSDSTIGGVWLSRNTAIATVNASTGVVTGVSVGSVLIIDSVTSGGCIGKDSIIVTVNARPATPTISGSPNGGNVCAGATALLSGNPAGGVWSSSNSAAASVNSAGLVTGIATGTTTINYTVSNAAGCTRTQTSNLNVISAGGALPAITGTQTVCVGFKTTFSNTTANGKWYSSDVTIAKVDSLTGVITGVAAGTARIVYEVSNGGGPGFNCPRTATRTVTVYSVPTITPIFGIDSICLKSYSLLTDYTGGGTWSSKNTNVVTVDNLGIINGVSVGSDSVFYTITNASTGCYSKAAKLITIDPLPIVSPITGSNAICIGKSTNLSNSTTGGVWSSSNISVATISTSGFVNTVSAGSSTINYKVTNIYGCSDSSYINFVVSALPEMHAIDGGSQVCVGSTLSLTDTTIGGVWSSSNSSVASINASTGLLTGLIAGTTTVKYIVTNATGCVDSINTVITVNALPVITPITGIKSICLGKTTTLSSTTSGGVVTNNNPTVATFSVINANSILVTGISVGIAKFTYTVTNASGCVDSVSTTVTVNALPTIAAINGASALCVGKTAQLTNSTSGGTWFTANSSLATINATGLVSGISAGNDTIRYLVTNKSGCTDSVAYTITVNPLPVIGAITGATTICVNGKIQLSDTTLNGTWTTANTSIATINGTGLVTGMSAGTGIIKYTVSNIYGCNDSVSTSFIVNALPIIAAITGNTSVCVGKTTQLSNNTTGGTWKSVNSSVATIDASGIITAIKAGSSIIRYTVSNANGCIDSVSTTVTVNALPVLTAIAGNTSICVGKSNTLTSSPAGGAWKSLSPSIASVLSGVVTGVSAGSSIIRYTVTNGSGCIDSISTSVTVNLLPVVNSITGTSTICVGKTTQLSETTTGGSWKSANTSIATVDATGLVTGVAGGNTAIRYIVTNSNGCTDSAFTNVTINALPAFTPITGSTAICMGKTSQLAETATGGTWRSLSNNIATVDANGLVTSIAVGSSIIRYTVTNVSGCTDSVSTTVTINAIPVVASITGNNILCAGKTSQLTENTTGGTWKSVNNSVATINSNGLVTAISAGTSVIRYIVTNVSGCTDSVSTTITVNALPVLTAITGNTSICVGKTSQLAETATGGSWISLTPTVATIDNNGLVTAISAGTSIVRYIATNLSSCTDSVSSTITVNTLPVLTAITGTTTLCAGKTATLSSTPTGGVWKSLSANVANISSAGLLTGLSTGTSVIRYTVTNLSGCVDSVSTTVTINALPVIGAITAATTTACAGKTIQLSDTTNGGTWKSASVNVATINTSGLVITLAAGTSIINYIVTNANGCTDSVSKTITVNALPVITPIIGKTSICVGQSISLSSTTTGGTWVTTNASVASINGSVVITGLADGITTIRYIVTNGSGCTDSVSLKDTVHALPVIAPIVGNGTVCVGNNITLSSTTTGGTWASVTPFVASVSTNGVVTGNFSGGTTIKYVVGNVYGCSDSVLKTITVNPTPVLGAITGASTSCVGNSLTLSNSVSGGKWSVLNNTIASIDSVSGLVQTLSAGTDTVIYSVTNGFGCSSSVNTAFVINAVPSVTAGSNSPVNSGDSIYLTALSSIQGVSYSWTGPNGFVAAIQNPAIANASTLNTGYYFIKASKNGCTSNPDSVKVVINASYYVYGSIKTPTGIAVPGSFVNIVGAVSKVANCDASGNYSTYIGGGNNSYVFAPSKSLDVKKSNGISSIDAALVQAHVLQKVIFNSPYKIIAADVSGDNKVSALDIVYMKRMILGVDTTFPNQRLWAYADSSFAFTSPTTPFPYNSSDTITNLSNNTYGKSFIAMKLGDVNWDWSAAIPKENIINTPVELYYSSTGVDKNGLVKIPIKVKNFKAMIGMQFTLGYNKDVFDFVSVDNNNLNIEFVNHAKDGNMSFLWLDPKNDINTLNDDAVLFELVLSKKANFETEDITIDSRVIATEAVDGEYVKHNITKTSGVILNKTVIASDNIIKEYVQVGPNPNNGKFNVEIGSNTDKPVMVTVVDENGKQLLSNKVDVVKGKNTYTVDVTRQSTSTGTYFLKIIDAKSAKTTKIIINK